MMFVQPDFSELLSEPKSLAGISTMIFKTEFQNTMDPCWIIFHSGIM